MSIIAHENQKCSVKIAQYFLRSRKASTMQKCPVSFHLCGQVELLFFFFLPQIHASWWCGMETISLWHCCGITRGPG